MAKTWNKAEMDKLDSWRFGSQSRNHGMELADFWETKHRRLFISYIKLMEELAKCQNSSNSTRL